MEKIRYEWGNEKASSEVLIGSGFLFEKDFPHRIQLLGKRFVIITTTQVSTLWGQKLHSHLKEAGLDIALISFEGGEQNKSRETKAFIEDQLVMQGYGRDTCVIALGGGIVTDLAGYVAATYLRGVNYVSIPTTLLGMVDASIGGKTGVNTPFGKNLTGAFYPSKMTFMDVSTLKTLSLTEFLNGISEIIKMGLVSSPQLFEELLEWKEEEESLKKMIYLSCREKIRVIEKDPTEKGLRRVLNFGHTIAHALEKLTAYSISHGEAVAFGMLIETTLSHRIGLLNSTDYEKICALISHYRPSFTFSELPPFEKWEEVLKRDKKSKSSSPRFVLLETIGKAAAFNGEYCTEVERSLLEEILCNYAFQKATFRAP